MFWLLCGASDNPHEQAATCRRAELLSESCRIVCLNCHRDDMPPDIYRIGDGNLCEECHDAQTDLTGPGNLLKSAGATHTNHPNAIDYRPDLRMATLAPAPTGPKLFVDEAGDNPRVYCSTCHDAMGSANHLLRVSKQQSALCFSCHRK